MTTPSISERIYQKVEFDPGGTDYSLAGAMGLWEHDKPTPSCNHGFASHAAVVLHRDIFGGHGWCEVLIGDQWVGYDGRCIKRMGELDNQSVQSSADPGAMGE